MMSLPPLTPVVSRDRLYPDHTVYMARSDLHQTRMLGYRPLNIDAVTLILLGVLGDTSTVRHRSGVTDEILTFLRAAGLQLCEDMHVYETQTEAETIAKALVSQGKRLFWPYPLAKGLFADKDHLVAPNLWARLNSKEQMGDLVTQDNLPVRQIIDSTRLGPDMRPLPAFLKAAGTEATGWGFAVRHVVDGADVIKARAHFQDQGVDRVIVEEAIDVRTCWCVNLSVVDDGVTYLGAAEQTFSKPGQQSGSVIDAAVPLPDAGVRLAVEVVKAAQDAGFRGICGLDIGLARDGRLIVFDPNFRVNASTAQVMLHPSAATRSGLTVSHAFSGQSTRTMTDIISQVRGPVGDGWFVPTRLLDQAFLPAANGTSLCTGFVMGRTRAQAAARADTLAEMIA